MLHAHKHLTSSRRFSDGSVKSYLINIKINEKFHTNEKHKSLYAEFRFGTAEVNIVGRKVLLLAMLLLTVAGLGASAWLAMTVGTITIHSEKIDLSPATYSVDMNKSSIYVKEITVKTTSDEDVEVEIKVLPGDGDTAKKWGEDFIAFAEPSTVTVNATKSKKVRIIHYCEDGETGGTYKVRVIAAHAK